VRTELPGYGPPRCGQSEGGGDGPAQAFAILPGMSQTSAHPLTQDLALKLGKHG